MNKKHNGNSLILEWQAEKAKLDSAKARELELREEIVKRYYDTSTPGTQNKDLGGGWILKAVVKHTLSLDKDVEKIKAVLNTMPDFISKHLVSWKPSLSKREFDKLEGKHKEDFQALVTTSEATPTLSLVEPKGKA